MDSKSLKHIAPPKMTTKQAEKFWDALTMEQKHNFAKMYPKLCNGELMLKHVNVTSDEKIVNIVLEPKEKPSKPTAPFAKHFPKA